MKKPIVDTVRPIFSKIPNKTPYNLLVKARYGVAIMGPTSDLSSASVPTVMYALSSYIVLRYNGIWLDMGQ